MQSKQRRGGASLQFATTQRDTALQLGLSYLLAAGAALGMYFWMGLLRVQQPYPVLIALVTACGTGLLCTLNLQYSLYLLELMLSRLTHDPPLPGVRRQDYKNFLTWRWPLISLFDHLQEAEQRLQQYAANELLTSDLRAKTLQQAGEAAAQAERNRIARELHDSIKQQIFSISISAAAAQAHWLSTDSGEARAALADIQRSAQEAQVEMQALLQQLRPAPLENTSLVDALHVQAQALGFRTEAQVHVEIGPLPDNERLLPGTQEAIFRLVQETFANIAKHARAHTVWLTVRHTEQVLCVEVRDDGQGFAPEQMHSGMGLENLRARARELHGETEIRSQPGEGTSVVITLPLLDTSRSPEEEARQQYEVTQLSELSRRGYQLGENMAYLGMALVALAALINIHWSVVLLGVLLPFYSYTSGNYYRLQIALKIPPESKVGLEIKRQQYHALLNLTRLLALALWYAFIRLGLQNVSAGWWLLICTFVLLSGNTQFARRKYYLNTERYYALLSPQELRWELDARRQALTRMLTLWFIACAAGLIGNHTLFAFPPIAVAQQTAYGIAVLLLVMGVSLSIEYVQIQRWRQTLARSKQSSGEVYHG